MSALEFPRFISPDNYIGVALVQVALIRLRYLNERVFDPQAGPFLGFLDDETKRAISTYKGDNGSRPVNFIMDANFTEPLNKELFDSSSTKDGISESDLEQVILLLENARSNINSVRPVEFLDDLSESALDYTKDALTDIRVEGKANVERERH
jgi:hypothetical protein